jgi:hypothetical protein
MRRDIDPVKLAGARPDRAPACARTIRRDGGPAHRAGRVDRRNLISDEPLEQMTNRGQPLLDTGCCELGVPDSLRVATCSAAQRRSTAPPGLGAPGQKFLRGAGMSAARARVADVRREEFGEAYAGALAGDDDEGECASSQSAGEECRKAQIYRGHHRDDPRLSGVGASHSLRPSARGHMARRAPAITPAAMLQSATSLHPCRDRS